MYLQLNEVALKFPERINKIIPRVLQGLDIKEKMKNWHIVEKWAEIVGKRIAKHAKATAVDSENLWVEVDNPVWQSQLFLMKEKIIQKIKTYNVNIKDIKFKIARSSNEGEES